MVVNLLAAITIVPSFYSIVKPKFARALLEEQRRAAAEQ